MIQEGGSPREQQINSYTYKRATKPRFDKQRTKDINNNNHASEQAPKITNLTCQRPRSSNGL